MSTLVEHSAAGLSYLACEGSGTIPVVLLHGIGSNARSFAPLIAAFEGRHPALAWNAPGYGASRPLVAQWPDANDYAAALNRLLAHLEISRCVLVGHSLGCLVAARFALVSPRSVASLMLISPALGYGTKQGDALPEGVARRIEELDRLGPQKFAAARAGGLLADPAARPDLLEAVTRAMADVGRPGYDQAARLLAGALLLEDAAKIDVPTTVVVGMQDRITPPANARRVFEALPAGAHAYREIADAGHAVCQEEPAAIAQAIVEGIAHNANAHEVNADA
jgi:pimeloyl-ACP methyl ester carboxylesterase